MEYVYFYHSKLPTIIASYLDKLNFNRVGAGLVPDLAIEEYERVVDMVERERIGFIAINAREAAFVDAVMTRIEARSGGGPTSGSVS